MPPSEGTKKEYNAPAPSIIPALGQPKWKRTFKTEDVAPAPPLARRKQLQDQQSPSNACHSGDGAVGGDVSRRRSPRAKARPTRPSGTPTGPLIVEVDESTPQASSTSSDQHNEQHVSTGPINNRTNQAADPAPIFPLCLTCHINEGRYTCPRCSAPYCSVGCYKIHDVPTTSATTEAISGADNGDETAIIGGGRCTESFYRDRVEGITKLDIKDEDNVKTMRNILARSAADMTDSTGVPSLEMSDQSEGDNTAPSNEVTEEELVELAQAVLGLENDNGGDADSDALALLESLPSHVREAFEASVRKGEMSHLVSQWKPWWESELGLTPAIVEGSSGESNKKETAIVRHAKHNDDNDDDDVDLGDILPSPPTFGASDSAIGSGPTLDERILSVKKLHGGKQRTKSLQYNVLDLLFGVACSLRLYNGKPQLSTRTVNNSDTTDDVDAAIGAAETLLFSSAVLDDDVRFESVEEAMGSCSEKTLKLSKLNMCNTSWAVLAADIMAILLSGRRGVLRALLDGKDLLRGGVKATKATKIAAATGKHGQEDDASRRYKLAQKKIEFYLSWCLEYWEDIISEDNLSDAARGWIERWESDQTAESALERTLLTADGSSSAAETKIRIAR